MRFIALAAWLVVSSSGQPTSEARCHADDHALLHLKHSVLSNQSTKKQRGEIYQSPVAHRCRVLHSNSQLTDQISVSAGDASARVPIPEQGLVSANGCFKAVVKHVCSLNIYGHDYYKGDVYMGQPLNWDPPHRPQWSTCHVDLLNDGAIQGKAGGVVAFTTPNKKNDDAWKTAQTLRMVMQNDANLVVYAHNEKSKIIKTSDKYDLDYAGKTCPSENKANSKRSSIEMKANSVSNATFPVQGLISPNGCFAVTQSSNNCDIVIHNTVTHAELWKMECRWYNGEKWLPCGLPCSASLLRTGQLHLTGAFCYNDFLCRRKGVEYHWPEQSTTPDHLDKAVFILRLGNDGNLIVDQLIREETALWSSGTNANAWMFELGRETIVSDEFLISSSSASNQSWVQRPKFRDSLYKGSESSSMLIAGETLMDISGHFAFAMSHSCALSHAADRWMVTHRIAPIDLFRFEKCFLHFQGDNNLVMYGSERRIDDPHQHGTVVRQTPLWSKWLDADVVKVQLRADGALVGLTETDDVKNVIIERNRHCSVSNSKHICFGAGQVCDVCAEGQTSLASLQSTSLSLSTANEQTSMALVAEIGITELVAAPELAPVIVLELALAGLVFWLFSSKADSSNPIHRQHLEVFLLYDPLHVTNQVCYELLNGILPTLASEFAVLGNYRNVLELLWTSSAPWNVLETLQNDYTLRLDDHLTESELIPIMWRRYNYRNSLDPRTAAVCWVFLGGEYPSSISQPSGSDVEAARKLQRNSLTSPCSSRFQDVLSRLCWDKLELPPISGTHTDQDQPDDAPTTTTTTSTTSYLMCSSSKSTPRAEPSRQTQDDTSTKNASSMLGIVNGEKFLGLAQPMVWIQPTAGHVDDPTKDNVCTGTVIGEGVVLTAAHCLLLECKKKKSKKPKGYIYECLTPRVVLRGYTGNTLVSEVLEFFALLGYKEEEKQRRNVIDVVFTSKYDPTGGARWLSRAQQDLNAILHADIALLRLAKWNAEWTRETNQIAVLDPSMAPLVAELFVMGYGMTNVNDANSNPKDGMPYVGMMPFTRPCASIAHAPKDWKDAAKLGDTCSFVQPGATFVYYGDSGGPAFCETKVNHNDRGAVAKESEVNSKLTSMGVANSFHVAKMKQVGVLHGGNLDSKAGSFSYYTSVGYYKYWICAVCRELWLAPADRRPDRCWGCLYI